MKAITFASLIASAFMGTSAGAQNLILNGGFESPLIPNNSRQTKTPISWTVGSSAILINGNGGTAIFPLPQEGQQYASVATSPIFTLSQNFSVTLGEEYMLQWFDSTAHGAGATSAPYSVAVLSTTSQILASANLEAYHPNDWTERSMSMALTPGNYTLRFTPAGNGAGGLSPLFDNVSITIVPEPSTFSLVFVAGLMILGHRKLRSRNAA